MTVEIRREYQRRWRADNPEKCAFYTNKYRAKHRDKYRDIQKRWRAMNRVRTNEFTRKWRSANRDKVNAAERKRVATNPSYRLARNLRARIKNAIHGRATKKADSTFSLTGCDLKFLTGYLEAQFRLGMAWENYGKVWEVDHRRPCASYDLTIEANQWACFHYSNLQPLFVGENRRKYAKILSDLQLQ